MRILVLIGHEPSRTVVCGVLRRAGHQVEGAGQVGDVVGLAPERCPDVVLLDVGRTARTRDARGRKPRAEDTYALIGEVRPHLGGAGLLVLADEPVEDPVAEGADAWVSRPFDPRRLVDGVRRAAEAGRLRATGGDAAAG